MSSKQFNGSTEELEARIRSALSQDADRAPLSARAPALRSGSAPGAGTRRRHRLQATLGLVATAAAVTAVLGATSLLSGPPSGGPATGSRLGSSAQAPVDEAAAAILREAAVAARANPGVAPRANQFIYTESLNVYRSVTQTDGGDSMQIPGVPEYRLIWLSADGMRDGMLQTREKANAGSWSTTPLPVCDRVAVTAPGSNIGACPAPPAYPSNLPTDRRGMQLYLHSISGGETHPPGEPNQPTSPRLFKSALDILREHLLPGAVRAALYEAMAEIPGVRAYPGATDLTGRPAVAISVPDQDGNRLDLLFDTSYAVLGERVVEAGKPTGEGRAEIRTAIVDKVGQFP